MRKKVFHSELSKYGFSCRESTMKSDIFIFLLILATVGGAKKGAPCNELNGCMMCKPGTKDILRCVHGLLDVVPCGGGTVCSEQGKCVATCDWPRNTHTTNRKNQTTPSLPRSITRSPSPSTTATTAPKTPSQGPSCVGKKYGDRFCDPSYPSKLFQCVVTHSGLYPESTSCQPGLVCARSGTGCQVPTGPIPTSPSTWPTSSSTSRPTSSTTIKPRKDCDLPNCRVPSSDPPGGFSPDKIPMFVYFTFDDGITTYAEGKVTGLFERIKNPGGSPVRSTMFVSGDNVNYDSVKDMYSLGFEMADHTAAHASMRGQSKSFMWQQIEEQRENMKNKADVPENSVRGFRAPYLDLGGDDMYDVLQELGFHYESSHSIITDLPLWPYTMDYPEDIPYQDWQKPEAPTQPHAGFYELPLNAYQGLSGARCSMLDEEACRVNNANDALEFYKTNFLHHYHSNKGLLKVPFAMNMHATYFQNQHGVYEGMKAFIDWLQQEYKDVWIVTAKDVLDWAKYPVDKDTYLAEHTCEDY